jgi:hypothetical protein
MTEETGKTETPEAEAPATPPAADEAARDPYAIVASQDDLQNQILLVRAQKNDADEMKLAQEMALKTAAVRMVEQLKGELAAEKEARASDATAAVGKLSKALEDIKNLVEENAALRAGKPSKRNRSK